MAVDLQNYKLQLEQVEAALTTAPDNEELLTLKRDLVQVIELSTELIKSHLPEEEKKKEINIFTPNLKLERGNIVPTEKPLRKWRVGDRCLALCLEDGQYYEATVDVVDGDEVSVLFDTYNVGVAVVLTKELLRELPKGQDHCPKVKKLPSSKERELLKKKKLKKQIRFKQLEEERETEKNKWLMFSSKTYKKGMAKKSIFASPDNVNGRVGIGTCGVAGRGMTEFQQAEKHKK